MALFSRVRVHKQESRLKLYLLRDVCMMEVKNNYIGEKIPSKYQLKKLMDLQHCQANHDKS